MTHSMKIDLVEKLDSGEFSELALGDKFSFECQDQCMGRCCTSITIFLDPWDIEVMARYLDMSGRDFIEQYCTMDFDRQIKWPYVYLRHASQGKCAFMLEDGKCRVYPARSRNCRTYPIGRAVRFDFAGGESKKEEKLFMVESQAFCFGHKGRQWTVRDWLEDSSAFPYYDLSDLYNELISYTSTMLLGKRWMSERTAQMIMATLFSPDVLMSKLGIGVGDVGHEEFYRRRIKALRVILTDMAAGFGFGPEAARFLEGSTPELSVMDRMKDILLTGNI